MKEVAENLLDMAESGSPWKVDGMEFIGMILEDILRKVNYSKFKFI